MGRVNRSHITPVVVVEVGGLCVLGEDFKLQVIILTIFCLSARLFEVNLFFLFSKSTATDVDSELHG